VPLCAYPINPCDLQGRGHNRLSIPISLRRYLGNVGKRRPSQMDVPMLTQTHVMAGATAPASKSTARKGDRVSISISVQVSGMDLSGKGFMEMTRTVNVSRSGCCVIIKALLAAGQKVHLQRGGIGDEVIGRVVGQIDIRTEGNVYGIEVLNPTESFWGIRFPQPKELEDSTGRVLLRCSACQNQEVAALNEVDLSVFMVTRHLTRKCCACSRDTVWEPVPEKRSADVPAEASVPERRKYRRVGMHKMACVGPEGPAADVVDIVDVSRGGVCFRSSHTYREDTWIQIAVPYTPDTANIFVAGRIVRSRKVNDQQTEYGVEYVKPHG